MLSEPLGKIMKNTQTPYTVIMCLGEMLKEDGTLHQEHRVRIEEAYAQWQRALAASYGEQRVVLVLTGGKTRPAFLSEASMAKLYFQKIAQDTGVALMPTQIIVEDISLTTAQNFFCAKKLCTDRDIRPSKVVIVARTSQAYKARVFAFWAWPFVKVTIVKTLDTKPLWYRLLDRTVLLLFAFLDPFERIRSFVTRLVRKH